MFRRGREKTSFDDFVERSMLQAMEAVVARGATAEQAAALAGDAYQAATDAVVPNIAARLHRTAPRMLREHRRIARRFQRRGIRRHWRKGLNSFYIYLVCAEEAGAQFNSTRRPAAAAANDLLFEALTGLHARACRTAAEIHHLLHGGFAMGALARCRTLHEIAVTALVLGDFGRLQQHGSISEKYLLHSTVLNWQDALVFQEHAERIGEDPLDADFMRDLKASRDELVNRYGTNYRRPYGWAADLCGSPAVSVGVIMRADGRVAVGSSRPG
jgi:hypothetical protein